MLFSYTKEDSAVYLSHLALIEVFSSALLRAAIPIQWTEGFNPMPKLEFAAPLAVGIASSEEIALTDISEYYDGGEFLRQLNPQLPEGIHITRAQPFTVPAGVKKHAVPALLWGFAYENNCGTDIVQAAADKNYRTTRCPATWAGLKRSAIFAKTPSNTPSTYFEVYQQLYGSMMPDERYRT